MQTTQYQNTDRGPGAFVGLIVVAVGTAFLLRNFGLLTLPPMQLLWPLIVIGVGVSLLLRRSQHATTLNGDRADISARFCNLGQRSQSAHFRGGRIDLAFSGLTLDLGAARIDGPEAVLDISTRFSNLELCVPADWQVVVEVAATAGSIDNRTVAPAHATQRLVLRGDTAFGNVVIRH